MYKVIVAGYIMLCLMVSVISCYVTSEKYTAVEKIITSNIFKKNICFFSLYKVKKIKY